MRPYLVVLLLVSGHVVIHVAASALDGQDAVPDGRDHVKLLDNGVHVARCPGILQPHKAFSGPRPHWR